VPEMSIKLYVLGGLTIITKGKDTFEVNGKTVCECLNHLVSLIPKMKEILFYETGETLALYSNIEVLVNDKSVNTEGLAKEVNDGDEIRIKKNNQ
jgi:molybdopterin converting factor small subunit